MENAKRFMSYQPGVDQTKMIDGLRYVPGYLTMDEADSFLDTIDANPWMNDLKRRVQHYGWRYDYKRKTIDETLFLGPLPNWGLILADRFVRDGFTNCCLDQLIVNEYRPGQGIAPHVDCVPCFAATIISVSLGSQCMMNF